MLDDGLNPEGPCWLFEHPQEIVSCTEPDAVAPALAKIARAVDRGAFAAGFFAYEVGYLLEPRLAPLLPPGRRQPLVWFGLFPSRTRLGPAAARQWLAERAQGGWQVENLRSTLDRDGYNSRFARVKDYIVSGHVYQINLTFKHRFEFSGDPIACYLDLRRRQRVAYGGIIQGPEFTVLSLSPELFLRLERGIVSARPMKGTAARGVSDAEDATLAAWLRGDQKSQAENLMIVDLLRNDLGRVSEIGSVGVTDLFTVERYRTLLQMTSGVQARLRPEIDIWELLRQTFPCGSVTGAPKIRAMEIIRELETEPRGVYTGSIGMITPDGDACFNVAIRTACLEPGGRGEMGIGSGLVFDSDPDQEFEECRLKAHFLTRSFPRFLLLETLKWQPGQGFVLLERHLARLVCSAAFFAYECGIAAIRAELERMAAGFGDRARRLRLLVADDGRFSISETVLPPAPPGEVYTYAISAHATDRRDVHRYHKTTLRDLYDGEWAEMQRRHGCDEVLFLNQEGELTEGSRTNLFIRRDGRLLTPPVSCGLLDGTLRRELLETLGPAGIAEAVLRIEDLEAAEAVFLGNSVRGLIPARPIGRGAGD